MWLKGGKPLYPLATKQIDVFCVILLNFAAGKSPKWVKRIDFLKLPVAK
jgi:hypothetical protein